MIDVPSLLHVIHQVTDVLAFASTALTSDRHIEHIPVVIIFCIPVELADEELTSSLVLADSHINGIPDWCHVL